MKTKLVCVVLLILVFVACINGCSTENTDIESVKQEPVIIDVYPKEIKFIKSIDTVFSLQKDSLSEVDNLNKSDIQLSGIFGDSIVDSITSLDKTYDIRIKGDLPIDHLYYEDDWVKDECGLIEINDKDGLTGFVAKIDIIYDELDISPREVEMSENNEYSFEIFLENGKFTKDIDHNDIILKGSFKDFEILGIEMINDNSFKISIKGETNGIGSGIIYLNSNVHSSGLSMDVLVEINSKPELFTSEIIFNEHYSEEDIVLHLLNAEFNTDISPNDIKVSGVFEGATINSVHYLDKSNIEIILTGELNKTEVNGIITIASDGTDYNKELKLTITKDICKVFADPSVIMAVKDGQINKYPILLKSFTIDFPVDLKAEDVKLSGTISEMNIDDIKLINEKELELVLSGSPQKEGTGTIEIGDSGLIKTNIIVDSVRYLVGRVYLDRALKNMKIEIINHDGTIINDSTKLIFGNDGIFFIEIDNHEDLGQDFRIIATGDYIEGNKVEPVTLMANIEKINTENEIIGVNAITTLASMYLDEYPDKSLKEAQAEIDKYLSLPKNHSFNSLLVEEVNYFSHEQFIGNSGNVKINEYLQQILEGIDNEEIYSFTGMSSNAQNKSEISYLSANTSKIVTIASISSVSAKFDFSEIVGSAAKSVAGAAGSQAFNFALCALGVDTTSSQLKEISTKLDELQKNMDENTNKQLAATYKSAFDIRMDTLNHYVNTINDLLTKVQALEKSTGSAATLLEYKKDILNSINAANIPTMLADINSQLTGDSSLLNLYKSYLKTSLPFRHEVVAPMVDLYNYCIAAQADGLYLYGVYCNQPSDSNYLINLYSDLKNKTKQNIINQAALIPKIDEGAIVTPGNIMEVQPIYNLNFYFPYTNDGTRWCIWGYIGVGSEWFDGDYAHFDNGTNWTRSERWYEKYYKVLDSWGYRPLSVNDEDLFTSQFLKGCNGSAHSFLADHGISMANFTRFYIEQDSTTVYYIAEDTCTADTFSGFGRYENALNVAYYDQSWMIVFRLR